jgi:hypothetical protein
MPGIVGKKNPKKPATRTPQVIREVIQHPSNRVTPRSVASAVALSGTIKGKKKDDPYKPPPQTVLPVDFYRRPDGTMRTPEEVKESFPAMDDTQLRYYRQAYNQAVAVREGQQSLVGQVATVIDSVANIITDVPGIVSGDAATIDDANAQAKIAGDVVRGWLGDHRQSQAQTGGTKGSTSVIDRSSANKKAWLTRKKLYGTSGRKDK